MDCQDISRGELAEKYLNGKLDGANQDAYETHLLECPTCARELELLQLVQTRLVERAPEIRGWTPPKPHFFRWQVVVVAGIVVAVATASMVVRWQKMQSASVTAPPPPPANPLPSVTVTRTEVAQDTPNGSANSPRRIDNLPIEQADHQESKPKNKPVTGNGGMPVESATTSGVEKKMESASTSNVNVDDKKNVDIPAKDARESAQVAEEKPKPFPSSNDGRPKQELTTAQAVELYELANVIAPPFTFSGFSTNALRLAPGSTNSHGRGGRKAEGDRMSFRQAMSAYIAGDYRRAGDLLEETAKVEPNAADVQFYLGTCRLLNGHAADAVQPLKRAAATDSPALRQKALYYLAKARLQDMHLGDAEDEFRAASELSGPLKTDSMVLLGRLQVLRAQLGDK